MPRRTAYAVLAALAAVVVLVSTAIFIGVGNSDGNIDTAAGKPRSSAAPASAGTWVGTWSTSAAAAEPNTLRGYAGMSIRNVVHTSVGGGQARIQLSNFYSARPLTITHASLALAAAPSNPTAAAGTMRRLTFAERPWVTIPPGQAVTSDPVRLDIPAAADLLVTTYTPRASGSVTYHPHARQTSY
ncbi:SGNH/GDSL hydrolase family protein, partial [Streptomyces sp. 2MCAF27]